MIVTPKRGLKSLCDKHRTPMSPCQFIGSLSLLGAFACDTVGCTRCYDVVVGYFDVVGEKPLLEKQQQRCPDDDLPMYLDSVRTDSSETWCCGREGCLQSKIYRR
jgi:hypothetical protein